ncbi:Retinol dehydrogenase 11 [Coccomyxa sp. Obi]|nr:Retinol dehydrogenase 11 [Coccomyxa sp. Obi]
MTSFKHFNFHTTALEVVEGFDLSGRTAIVTGGNSGIGVETVRTLAVAGARVILCSRSVEAGQKVADQLKADGGIKGEIVVKQLDLADLQNIHNFTQDYLAHEKGPDLLILNAGIMACPESYTKDGFEMQIGTNYFGHFALTRDLLPSMKALKRPARVVVVSSLAHRMLFSPIDVSDLHNEKSRYIAGRAYARSKVALILFAKEFSRRNEGTNIKAYSLAPGQIRTPLQRHVLGNGGFLTWIMEWIMYILGSMLEGWKTPAQGASTTLVAALSPDLEAHPGAYLDHCQIKTPSKAAQDMDMAAKLWAETERQLAVAEKKITGS